MVGDWFIRVVGVPDRTKEAIPCFSCGWSVMRSNFRIIRFWASEWWDSCRIITIVLWASAICWRIKSLVFVAPVIFSWRILPAPFTMVDHPPWEGRLLEIEAKFNILLLCLMLLLEAFGGDWSIGPRVYPFTTPVIPWVKALVKIASPREGCLHEARAEKSLCFCLLFSIMIWRLLLLNYGTACLTV